ncbi:MAG TPA: ASCH domain-containing protein [Chitinophagales bacterium]|nr:ASCH domain-containing protein [Chitinophagales bacterium]
MKVVLSIKPEFADKIFEGTKRYEFRRAIFKNTEIKKVIVYCSSPVQMIIGEFEIDRIITYDLKTLWQKTKKYAGISEDFFFQYFGEKELGFAIKIKSTKLYRRPKCIRTTFNLFPPQSFLYLA